MYLSLAVLLISPSVPPTFNNLSVIKTLPSNSKPDASGEILAATNSLESGRGPSGLGAISCLQYGLTNAACARSTATAHPLLSAASSASGLEVLVPAHISSFHFGRIVF